MIGLEVHAYVQTRSKMFCRCPLRFWDAEPGTLLCPVCTAQPGAKPMAPNARALELGLQLAMLLGCEVREAPVRFLRKHYFYPDLPSNYQRTSEPFATGGAVLGVPLREVHWEEDPGAYEPRAGLVDYNRSGAPLLEIVTEPAVRGPAHAREVIEELRLLLSYLGALAPAGMKADANLSLPGGERVEVKNVNSARNVELALAHEADRQARVLAAGQAVRRETRHFDEAKGTTLPLRAKESEEDYRHLPDPDLAPVDVPMLAARARAMLPPHPHALRAAWQGLGTTRDAADTVLGEPGLAAAFLALPAELRDRDALDFLVGDLRRELHYRQRAFAASGLAAEDLRALLVARRRGLPRARVVALLRGRLDGGPGALQAALAAEQPGAVGDAGMEEAVRAAIEANPRAVEDFRRGKREAANRVMGDAMRRLQGRVAPAELRARVLAALEAGGMPADG